MALYRQHKDAVYRFALLYCGSTAAAADVTQDTLVHFITQPDQWIRARHDRRVALRAWRATWRRKEVRGREHATDPADLDDDTDPAESRIDRDSPLEQVLRDEAAEQVRKAVASIKPHYRDVLILCELSERLAEAAQVCGIDIGTVRSRLSRARAQLAQRLAPYLPTGNGDAKEAVS